MNIVPAEVLEKDAAEYEAPCVEAVVLPEDIAREVAYAGVVANSGVNPAA